MLQLRYIRTVPQEQLKACKSFLGSGSVEKSVITPADWACICNVLVGPLGALDLNGGASRTNLNFTAKIFNFSFLKAFYI